MVEAEVMSHLVCECRCVQCVGRRPTSIYPRLRWISPDRSHTRPDTCGVPGKNINQPRVRSQLHTGSGRSVVGVRRNLESVASGAKRKRVPAKNITAERGLPVGGLQHETTNRPEDHIVNLTRCPWLGAVVL